MLPNFNELFYGYSDYWRRNKSTLETREMAYVLRALNKVGAYITTNIKPIEWAGMSSSPKGKIVLDTNIALGEYPLPPWKMDLLVGFVVKEAFRCKGLSDMVLLYLDATLQKISAGHRFLMLRMVDIGEDVYANQITRGSVWEHYVANIWDACRPKETRDLSLPPTAKCLFQIWDELMLAGRIHSNIHYEYVEPLQYLISCAEEILKCVEIRSLSERSKKRSDIYIKTWFKVEPHIKKWESEVLPEHEKGVEIQDERGRKKPLDEPVEDDEESGDQDRPARSRKSLSELFREIKKVLDETEETSLDREVQIVCGERTEGVMETVFANSTQRCLIEPDPSLVQRLKRTFELQRSARPEKYRVNRGLYFGKIDGRRLYRAVLDGKVFSQKEFSILHNAWNITILVDASASMKGGSGLVGKSWTITEKTFVSLCEAAKGSGNTMNVYAYMEHGGRCQVTRLFHNERLYTLFPQGRTPTGQAIIAAALKTPKDKRRLIVHITDGEPNCGVGVEQAVEFCSKEGIELVTIGCYYDKDEVKEMFREQYGEKVYLMDSLEYLPEGLETLLRKILLSHKTLKAG